MLPAFNESASILDLLERIAEISAREGWDYDILVVDDGSSDGTGELVAQAADQGVPASVVRNEPNRGLGYTIRRGLREAASRSSAEDVIITLDADLTQDPVYAPSMLERISAGYDVVVASRYRAGSAIEGLSMTRRLLSYGASGLVALLRPVRGVRDYSCGFRAYRAEVIQKAFERYGDGFVTQTGFACMLEIAEKLRDMASFTEVPFVLHYDAKRKASAIRIGPTITAYFAVIFDLARRGRKPIPVATLLMAFASVVFGAYGQMFLRLGAQGLEGIQARQLLLDAVMLPQVQFGLVLYAISSLLWLGILSRMDLSVAYPLGASGYVLVVVLAALGGEPVPPLRWAGVALIVFGVMLVGWLGTAPVVKARRV